MSTDLPGLPDVAALARLANEIFGQMGTPTDTAGTVPARAEPVTPAAVSPYQAPDRLSQSAGAVSPASIPEGLPKTATGPAAPLDVATTPTSAPSYYFIAETNELASQPRARSEPDPFGAVPAADLSFVDRLTSHTLLPTDVHRPFDVEAVRRDFPTLDEHVNGHRLVWLDNAATTQKPQVVIDRLTHFYTHENSNIHRAAHELAARATDAYEAARTKVAGFIGAPSSDDIVFVRGATEGINLVAQSWGRQNVGPDDEIVISHLEHHANIVPWQQLANEKGAKLRVIPVDDSGQILLDEYAGLLSDRTRLVAVAHVSNALGTILPIHEVIEMAHRVGARVLVDGAQAVPHTRIDMQAFDADFYVFSGHKVFAPTGIGVLYGKSEVLESMPPWQGGGNVIRDVTFERTLYQPPPTRFEAGTGSIADAVGLGAAIDYLERVGIESVTSYEQELLGYATQEMQTVPGLHLIGTAPTKTGIVSFTLDGYRTEDVGSALNREGIAVRAGHHCAQPIMRRYGLEATVRPSLAMYNTCAEIDLLVAALHRLAANASRIPTLTRPQAVASIPACIKGS